MLLRRVTQHVKDQSWFAVGLDLVVVVFGIFLGLQVSDWNESRKEYQEGRYYLHALNAQVAEAIAEGAEEIERTEAFTNDTFGAVMILWSEQAAEDDLQTFQKLHLSAFQFWGPLTRPAALRQLVDDGKIDLIRSKDMQQAILDYDNAYVEAIQQTQTSYAYSKDLTLVIMNSIQYRPTGITSTLEALKNNQDLISALRGKAIFQRIQLDTLMELMKAHKVLQKQLDTYLGSEQQ